MAVDPTKITDYQRSIYQLEELLLFCIAVAGKNATTTAANLQRLLEYGRQRHQKLSRVLMAPFHLDPGPFRIIRTLADNEHLASTMKSFGFGCYKLKSKGFIYAATSNIHLRNCTVDDLDAIPGVGRKTARFFVLHTRKNAQVACLDTHILKWLAYYTGHDIPRDKKGKIKTPSKKKYLELEQIFLEIARVMKMSPADLDLKIWNRSRGTDEESLAQNPQAKTPRILDSRVQRLPTKAAVAKGKASGRRRCETKPGLLRGQVRRGNNRLQRLDDERKRSRVA